MSNTEREQECLEVAIIFEQQSRRTPSPALRSRYLAEARTWRRRADDPIFDQETAQAFEHHLDQVRSRAVAVAMAVA